MLWISVLAAGMIPAHRAAGVDPASAQFNAALSEVLGLPPNVFAPASCRPSTPDQSYWIIGSCAGAADRPHTLARDNFRLYAAIQPELGWLFTGNTISDQAGGPTSFSQI
jgi:hypothetical protein